MMVKNFPEYTEIIFVGSKMLPYLHQVSLLEISTSCIANLVLAKSPRLRFCSIVNICNSPLQRVALSNF